MVTIERSAKALTLALASAFFFSTAGSVLAAETQWQKHHPRRAEVNKRLARQNQRIRKERKEGDLTKAQAATLHKNDRQVRTEERSMASQNGGHISKQEKRTLNQQENQLSRQIGK